MSACAGIRMAARADLAATRHRDPACRTYADCLLFFKVKISHDVNGTHHVSRRSAFTPSLSHSRCPSHT